MIEYSTFSHQLTLLDNVWNFSSATASLSRNAISAHGPNGTVVGTTYYYALGPVLSVGYPFTASLFLSASTEGTHDVVFFNYSISSTAGTYTGTYDFVSFNNTAGPVPPPAFIASGFSDNALGLPNDFELVVGGPGGGSNFDAFNASALVNLYYWDATTGGYHVVPSAEDVGGDTGETAAGVSSTWAPGADLGLGGTSGPVGSESGSGAHPGRVERDQFDAGIDEPPSRTRSAEWVCLPRPRFRTRSRRPTNGRPPTDRTSSPRKLLAHRPGLVLRPPLPARFRDRHLHLVERQPHARSEHGGLRAPMGPFPVRPGQYLLELLRDELHASERAIRSPRAAG